MKDKNYTININNLKVGDKVKYFQNRYTILDSKISEIVTNMFGNIGYKQF